MFGTSGERFRSKAENTEFQKVRRATRSVEGGCVSHAQADVWNEARNKRVRLSKPWKYFLILLGRGRNSGHKKKGRDHPSAPKKIGKKESSEMPTTPKEAARSSGFGCRTPRQGKSLHLELERKPPGKKPKIAKGQGESTHTH